MVQRGLAFYVNVLRVISLLALLAAAGVGIGALWVPTAQAMVLPFALFALVLVLLAGLGSNVQRELQRHSEELNGPKPNPETRPEKKP
jgi:hypothetical protein